MAYLHGRLGAQNISWKDHPELNEKWVHARIDFYKDPPGEIAGRSRGSTRFPASSRRCTNAGTRSIRGASSAEV